MEKCLEVARLLGEKNVEKIKNSVTDMLIERCRDELDDMAIYMVDYEQLFSEIEDEVRSIVKDRIMQVYLKQAEHKISELAEQIVL